MSKYEGFVEKGGASVLIDGQWGSTGKGLAAAAIAVDNAGKITAKINETMKKRRDTFVKTFNLSFNHNFPTLSRQ